MKKILLSAFACSAIFSGASAQVVEPSEVKDVVKSTDNVQYLLKPRFSWGIDAGSAIDVTGNDMSAVDINACFGYSGPYVRLAGIGAGIDMMVSSSSNTYPVYAIFRTDFKPTPQLCFLELRGGMAFSNIETFPMQKSPFGSIGVGVTLAKGRTFSSHIILSYNYIKLDDVNLPDGQGISRVHDLQYASMKIGISF